MTNSKFPVALVTGGARRIGRAIVEALHENGYRIVVHYHHSASEADALVLALNQRQSNSAVAICADLLKPETLSELIDKSQTQWGRLDVLINNASNFFPTPVGTVDSSVWDDLFGVNVKAPYFLSQLSHPHLLKTHGNIINIIDIHAEHTYLNHSVYCAAKAALLSLTKNLARELAPTIRVNGVSPGPTLWPEGEHVYTDDKKEKVLKRQPLKKLSNPNDIANAVVFLIQNASMTGQVIAVDSGRSLV